MKRTLFLIALVVATIAPTTDASLLLLTNTKNWGIFNSNKIRSHIDAPHAWNITHGSSKVIVAVIDTGVDVTHKDLSKNIWHDPKDSSHKIYGWNFVTNKINPVDDHGHGTHVAGIIGAVIDMDAGVAGVAQRVSIMPIKYYSDSNPGSVNLRNTIKAIRYAVDHGAKIINYSGGGPEFSEEEYLAIKYAEQKGVLFIAAAGNEHENVDLAENYFYPGAYRLSNIIVVAATDINNNLIPSSNWGMNKVDVAAPGENIYSTLPGGHYGYMSGTSQATAFVSGIAALILAKNPNLKPKQVKKIIINSVDKELNLSDKVLSGGKVNAYKALQEI